MKKWQVILAVSVIGAIAMATLNQWMAEYRGVPPLMPTLLACAVGALAGFAIFAIATSVGGGGRKKPPFSNGGGWGNPNQIDNDFY